MQLSPGINASLELVARSSEQLDAPVEICDLKMVIQHVNAAWVRSFGYSQQEAVGRTPADLVRSALHTDEYLARPREVVTAGGIWFGRLVSRARDGREIHSDTTIFPLLDDKGETAHMVAVRRDVSAAERAQANLRKADRLAALGQLASGAAHQINNPLTVVSANLGALEFQVQAMGSPGEPLLELISEASASANRIAEVVRDLQSFVQPVGASGSVDVSATLEATVRLLHAEIKHRARLVRHYNDVPLVAGDSARLSQLFLNLLLNATQAIDPGDASNNEIRLCIRRKPSERKVLVEVIDSGRGIPPAILGRVFDPFFTTRPAGSGSGLGLFLCHQIVQQIGGSIVADSDSQGTIIRVELPIETSSSLPVRAATTPDDTRGRILVIDDEPLVSRAIARVLRNHEVVICEGAAQALELMETRFDAIICDVMMPETSGTALYDIVSAKYPWAKDRFLFVTGGVFDRETQEALSRTGRPTLKKPLGASELQDTVREMITYQASSANSAVV